jgi:hypothetical protein
MAFHAERWNEKKLLRYTTDYLEAYPDINVLPVVLFTDRKKWRKNVDKVISNKIGDRLFLHFEYKFVKLFDFNAKDYYQHNNPLVKILLPKMNYQAEERPEMIRQAYLGLFELVSSSLFDKYIDFIDIYAEIEESEHLELYKQLEQKKETFMLAQYIREQGMQQGMQQGEVILLERQIRKKFTLESKVVNKLLSGLNREQLEILGDKILEFSNAEEFLRWFDDNINV